jgi:hypothetical protein
MGVGHVTRMGQIIKVEVKVKFTLEQATKPQRGRRGIAIRIL